MVKLSIGIPYYKTFELTVALLERLIPQLTEETEVILVDDGCDEARLNRYKDEIKIEHLKENIGGAGATNKTIDLATGEYMALIDSDDQVSEDYVAELLKAINETNAELIYMDWEDQATGIIVQHPNNYAPWKCIYKRDKMPRFIEGWKYSYDVPFHEAVESLGLKKYYIDKVLYYYNSGRPDNLTHQKAEIIARGEK